MKGIKMIENIISKFNTDYSVRSIFLLLILLLVKTSQAQWQPDVRLTNDTALSNTSRSNVWNVKANGNFVHIIWFDNRDGNTEIYYKRSTNGGMNWEADIRLTNSNYTEQSTSSSLSVYGSDLHVAWIEYRDGNPEIYYKRSTDEGTSWGVDTRLTNNSALSYSPAVEAAGSSVHVFWYDFRDGYEEIYYKRSTDGGISWGADTRLTNDPAISFVPSVTISGSIVNVFWTESRDGNFEIYCKRSTDGGINWGADTRLTNDTATSWYCTPAVSGSIWHLVWTDNRDGNNETYYKRSTDGGISWGADTRLTNNIADSFKPSLSVSGTDVHVIWADTRDGNYEIYYKRSTDGGLSWGTDLRLTNASGYSFNSSISVSASGLHVVWWDERDGNHEIYYKRNPQNININISMIIEGFYNIQTNGLNMNDTVKVYLRSSTVPYTVIDSAKSVIDSLTFSGSFVFSNAASGSYYIMIKHRNSIETWSKTGGEYLTKGETVSYDFSNVITQAFGSNMILKGTKYCFYSGDVNQDGIIDVSDLGSVYNDVKNSVSGYLNTDLTGNNFVDISDLSIVYNNNVNSVQLIRP